MEEGFYLDGARGGSGEVPVGKGEELPTPVLPNPTESPFAWSDAASALTKPTSYSTAGKDFVKPGGMISGHKSWCRRWDSNPHGSGSRGILSPLRLPIPPLRQPRKLYDIDPRGVNQASAAQANGPVLPPLLRLWLPVHHDDIGGEVVLPLKEGASHGVNVHRGLLLLEVGDLLGVEAP